MKFWKWLAIGIVLIVLVAEFLLDLHPAKTLAICILIAVFAVFIREELKNTQFDFDNWT